MASIPEIAFYYPGPIWYHSEVIKNLLLFFDGVALLVPEYMADRPEYVDPSLVVPLREKGLLHILRPEELLDRPATELLATQMADIIHSGFLDDLSDADGEFAELSMSRLGYAGDAGLADMIFAELKARGLARESQDGVSIPMHQSVRNLILVLLSQILRPRGDQLGLDLSPATDRPQLVSALTEMLSHPDVPSAGHVVAADMATVGVDLSITPLDEVLSFRSEHGREHRTYAKALRSFIRELSQLPSAERTKAMDARYAELDELAADLRRRHRKAWKKPASFGLSAAGAIWTVASGDPLGALLAAGALAAGTERSDTEAGGAFSYLFAARNRLGY